MKLRETIDECIHEMQRNLDTWKSVKDNREFFESQPSLFGVSLSSMSYSANRATIKEIDDSIVKYQKHLDNLNLLKQYFLNEKELNYE